VLTSYKTSQSNKIIVLSKERDVFLCDLLQKEAMFEYKFIRTNENTINLCLLFQILV